jgi:hypothetical protein
VKNVVDISGVRGAIVADPWGSVALAFAAGACLALIEPRGPIARAITGTLGAMALTVLRESATRRFAAEARSWIDARTRPGAQPAVVPSQPIGEPVS